MTITGLNHPADQAICRPTSIRTMSVSDLRAADVELARRAVLLGKAGQISGPHRLVRAAIANHA